MIWPLVPPIAVVLAFLAFAFSFPAALALEVAIASKTATLSEALEAFACAFSSPCRLVSKSFARFFSYIVEEEIGSCLSEDAAGVGAGVDIGWGGDDTGPDNVSSLYHQPSSSLMKYT